MVFLHYSALKVLPVYAYTCEQPFYSVDTLWPMPAPQTKTVTHLR